jgi:hypothetical protein
LAPNTAAASMLGLRWCVWTECQFTVKLDPKWHEYSIDQGQSDCIILAQDR